MFDAVSAGACVGHTHSIARRRDAVLPRQTVDTIIVRYIAVGSVTVTVVPVATTLEIFNVPP